MNILFFSFAPFLHRNEGQGSNMTYEQAATAPPVLSHQEPAFLASRSLLAFPIVPSLNHTVEIFLCTPQHHGL